MLNYWDKTIQHNRIQCLESPHPHSWCSFLAVLEETACRVQCVFTVESGPRVRTDSPESVICRCVISQLGVLAHVLILLFTVAMLVTLEGVVLHSTVLLLTAADFSLTVLFRWTAAQMLFIYLVACRGKKQTNHGFRNSDQSSRHLYFKTALKLTRIQWISLSSRHFLSFNGRLLLVLPLNYSCLGKQEAVKTLRDDKTMTEGSCLHRRKALLPPTHCSYIKIKPCLIA